MYFFSLVVKSRLQEIRECLIVDHFWLWWRSDQLKDAIVDLDSYIVKHVTVVLKLHIMILINFSHPLQELVELIVESFLQGPALVGILH